MGFGFLRVYMGVGEGCGRVVVWDGVVLICGVWFSLCVRGVGEGCGGIVVRMEGSYPVAGGLILWERRLDPMLVIWVSF